MNLINFLWTCEKGAADSIYPILSLAATVVHIIQFAIPIALIIFGMIDLGKAVVAGKEDEQKKAQQTLIKRFIYAVLIFFIITLVGFVMGIVGDTANTGTADDTNSWSTCWEKVW